MDDEFTAFIDEIVEVLSDEKRYPGLLSLIPYPEIETVRKSKIVIHKSHTKF